jgi:hypothetical protein
VQQALPVREVLTNKGKMIALTRKILLKWIWI